MDRLTNRGTNSEIWITDNDTTRTKGRQKAAYEKLAMYEDLEEQGRLLKLPCKIGDTVWNYSYFGLRDYKVTYMGFDKDGLLYFDCESGITYSFRCYLKDFKDKIFLTKSEAEAKLKIKKYQ